MSYVSVANAKAGMDRRRPRAAGEEGTLWSLVNAHVTRGGDIERCKAFVEAYTLPAGTSGLAQVDGQLVVFGKDDLAASVPPGIQYQRLTIASDIDEVLSTTVFDRTLFTTARLEDASMIAAYGSTAIDFSTMNADNSSFASLSSYLAERIAEVAAVDTSAGGTSILITGVEDGDDISMSVVAGTTTLTVLQTAQTEAAETRATATITITGGTNLPTVNEISALTVGGTAMISAPVPWATSNNSTATALKNAILALAPTHLYTATVLGNVVTVHAPVGDGAGANGRAVALTLGGDVTATTSGPLAGGVAAVVGRPKIARIDLNGAYSATAVFTYLIDGHTVTATGASSGAPIPVLANKNRVWTGAGSLLRFSQLNDPSDFVVPAIPTSTDAGYINVSSETGSSERLQAMAVYANQVAVFTRSAIHMWKLDTSPANNERLRTLENTGTMALRSVAKYGNEDVFYLSDMGVRSIKARDVTDAAYVGDAGTPIDTFLQEDMAAASAREVRRACAIIDPLDGRYWLALGSRIYVLSYFPSGGISAWSYYEPGFAVDEMVRCGKRIYVRSGDTIYLYGGRSGREYPDAGDMEPLVELPFLTAEAPASEKRLIGIDMVAAGIWETHILVNPEDETQYVDAGNLVGVTTLGGHVAAAAGSSHFAVRMRCISDGAATISGLQVHYFVADAR